MTTDYAQQVHLAARVDVHRNGRICADTALALMGLGYTQSAVADLEQRLIDGTNQCSEMSNACEQEEGA